MDEGNSNQILIAVTQLQTQMGTVSEQLKEISKIGQTVVEVVESSKQAHRRLDDIKSEVDKSLKDQKESFDKELDRQKEDYCEKIAAETKAREKTETSLTWAWRTILTLSGSGIVSILIWLVTNKGG